MNAAVIAVIAITLFAAVSGSSAQAQGFTQVSVGGQHACAVLNDGAVQCWGSNASSQLTGSDTQTVMFAPRVVLALPPSSRVASGDAHTCALTQQVGVFCWGGNGAGQTSYAPSSTPLATPQGLAAGGSIGVGGIDIGSGLAHSCMLKDTGEVVCWGSNSYGEHGDTLLTGYAPSYASGVTSAIALAVGGNHACAVLFNGTVKCWGRNHVGQTGVFSSSTATVPTPGLVPGLTAITAIAAGRQHTCSVGGGQVRCWGSNTWGQLGSAIAGTQVPTLVPGISDAVAVTAGDKHSCARLASGAVKCWGDNSYGEVGDGFATALSTGVVPPTTVVNLAAASQVSAGTDATCAITSGYVRCWGDNSNGRIGNNARLRSPVPVRAGAIADAVEIAASSFAMCARHQSGAVSCWGDNYYGEVGGTTLPGVGWPQAVAGISNAVSIAGGERHFCAALATGSVQCWGDNGFYQLGTSAVALSTIPLTVPNIANAVAVTAGYRHSCALLSGGAIRCWGSGSSGQLGNGATGGNYMSASPVDVINLGGAATAVAAGSIHTCALVGGFAKCWGDNSSYQIGDGTTTPYSQPRTAVNLTNAIKLTAGRDHNCVITSASRVACWGSNAYNKAMLFTGSPSTVMSPLVAAILGDRVEAGAGYNHTCALAPDGYVTCAGLNSSGELGLGTVSSTSTSSPWTRVAGLSGATALAAGRGFSCALRTDRSVWCWGGNDNGELGDGRGVQTITSPQTVMSGVCSLDLDDDGRVGATTDGVQLVRSLLGFSGAALTQGVLGGGAQRTSASAIREHLRINCGIPGLAP